MLQATSLRTYNTLYDCSQVKCVWDRALPYKPLAEGAVRVPPHIRYVDIEIDDDDDYCRSGYQAIPLLLFLSTDTVVEYPFSTWLKLNYANYIGMPVTKVYDAYCDYTKNVSIGEIIRASILDSRPSATLNRGYDGSICWGSVGGITMENVGEKFLGETGNGDLANRVLSSSLIHLQYKKGVSAEEPTLQQQYYACYDALMKLLMIRHLDATGIECLDTRYRIVF